MFNSTLPDGLLPVGDVEGMRRFLSMLITPPQPTSMFIQIYVAIGIVFGFVVLALAIITRRLVTGSAWLVQFHHTTRGAFIMPNAVLSLAIFLTIYNIISNVMGVVAIKFYRDGYQANYLLFKALFGYPAWLAALISCAGTLGLFPDALRLRGKGRNKLRMMLLHPTTVHAVLFGAPVLCFVSVLTPALIGNRIFNRVPAMHKLWLEKASEPSASVAELAAEAKAIWLDVTHAYYYDSVTFGVWVGWVCVLGLLMFSIALHVLLSVRSQVKLADLKKEELARTQPTFYLFSSRPNYGNLATESSRPLADPSSTASMVPDRLTIAEGSHDNLCQEMVQRRSSELDANAQTGDFVPSPQPEKLTKVQAAMRRSTALKLVYRNLLFQYAAIMLGVGAHGSNALLIALTSYTASREVTTMGVYHQAEALVVCYINILCIGCVIVMILWRSLDSAFTLDADAEVEEVSIPFGASDVPLGASTPQRFQRTPSPFDRLSSAENSAWRGSTIDISMDKA